MKIPARVMFYVAILAAAALCSTIYSAFHIGPLVADQISISCIFVILAVLAEVYATWIPTYNWEISSSIAIYLAALFILGAELAVLLVFVASLRSEMLLRWRSEDEDMASGLLAIAFNVSQLVVTVTLAGFLLQALQRQSLDVTGIRDLGLAIATFGIYFAANLSFVIGIVALTEAKKFTLSLADSIRQFFVQYLVLCVSALLLSALYSISVWHVLLALFPLTLVHVSFRGYVKLQTEARNTFEKISQLLDARDHYTAVHSMEVAALAVKIGVEMGLGRREIERIDIAARVHDIGKIAVPDAILLKPGKLSEDEWIKMREHPVISAELIAGIEIYSPVAKAVRHEHERWNGTGYPDGLKGEEIPLLSRIIAAADIYNALSTDRPYRKAFSREETARMINDMTEVELDPLVSAALLRVLEDMPAEPEVHPAVSPQLSEG